MAKKVNWTSNLRVDVADLEQGTHGYSDELMNEFNERVVKDVYPRVSDGFRVEVSDVTNRVLTVYSGVATDQTGRILTNAESLITSRSITLGGDTTYYLEVEFTETLGTTNARAMWDPTYDNGLDTSGDVIPDGRESSQNISTRKVHDWEIVDPPSTSGFQLSSSPSSTRVPLAVITVAGGVITAPTASVLRTCFARTYLSGVTSIRVLDSRLLPNSFTARLGPGSLNQEDISVIDNDRANGILTLGAGTANAHDIGERLVDFGGSLFIDERVLMDDATNGEADGGGIIARTAGDARLRMFQGDTEAGYALSQDPSSDTGNSDAQLKNLKEQVDYLASQMLEMKYGAGSRDLLGTLAPPSDFSTTEHFSRSGGILPSRAHTVSVGDGVSSWGDFNTTTSGTARDAIVAALGSIPTNGGILYIKEGTYDLAASSVSIDSNVSIVGDGRYATIIRCTAAGSFSFTNPGTKASLSNLSITDTGGVSLAAVEAVDTTILDITDCEIHGLSSGSFVSSKFSNSKFVSGPGINACFQGSASGVTFSDCEISPTDATDVGLAITSGTDIQITGCAFNVPSDGASIVLSGSASGSITDCTFDQASTAGGTTGVGIDATDVVNLSIHGCSFVDTDYAVYVWEATGLSIVGCHVTCAAGRGRSGFTTATTSGGAPATPSWDNINISACTFRALSDTSVATIVGIDCAAAVADPAQDVSITNCLIQSLGDLSLGNTNTYGIRLRTTGVVSTSSFINAKVADCDVNVLAGSSLNIGIEIQHAYNVLCTGNLLSNIGVASVGATIAKAVLATQCSGLVVSHNSISVVGSTSASLTGGVIHVGGNGQTAQQSSIVVASNTMQYLRCASGLRGIYIEDNAKYVSINGNTIDDASAELSTGIFVGPEINADSVDLGMFSISSNIIEGCSTGIFVVMDDPAVSLKEGAVSITGNTLSNFRSTGVYVEGYDGDETVMVGVTVSGNTIRTIINESFSVGVRASSCSLVVVSGNNIYMGAGASSDVSGIALSSVAGAAISGNIVIVLSGQGNLRGIDLNIISANVTDSTVASNYVEVAGDTTATVVGIDGGATSNFLAANFSRTPSGGSEIPITGGRTLIAGVVAGADVNSTNYEI